MHRNATASTKITWTYKKANKNIKKRINKKGEEIVEKSFDNNVDRMDDNTESNCFLTIKNHKKTF